MFHDFKIRSAAFEALGYDWYVAEALAFGDYIEVYKFLENKKMTISTAIQTRQTDSRSLINECETVSVRQIHAKTLTVYLFFDGSALIIDAPEGYEIYITNVPVFDETTFNPLHYETIQYE